MSTSEQTRPSWAANNAAAYNYWFRSAASQLPADWIDDGDLPPPTVTASHDLHFARCVSTDARGVDEIDRRMHDHHDHHDHHSPSRRSDESLARILELLDELQAGKEESCPTER